MTDNKKRKREKEEDEDISPDVCMEDLAAILRLRPSSNQNQRGPKLLSSVDSRVSASANAGNSSFNKDSQQKCFEKYMTLFGVEPHAIEAVSAQRLRISAEAAVEKGLPIYADALTRDAPGDAGLERALLLTNHVKQYRPVGDGRGQLKWVEDFEIDTTGDHILVLEEPLRSVPVTLLEALRPHLLALQEDGRLFDEAAAQIALDPLDLNPEKKMELQKKALEHAIARHVEGVADAMITMVTEFLQPYVQCATDTQRRDDSSAALGGASPATAVPDNATVSSSSSSSSSSLSAPRALSAKSKRSLPERKPFACGWEHVLLAVQAHADELVLKNAVSVKVHETLPAVRLTSNVVARFQERVLAMYGNM